MDLSRAVEVFKELRVKIAENRSYLSGNETVTRILLIDPVLEILGWDVRDPDRVELEYGPAISNRSTADYVLKHDNQNVAIVEAKRFGTDIGDLRHREQADGYARYAGVKFFVLTDGATWGLYERDLMTSIEVLAPKVRFDLANDDLVSCALKALSMWRANLNASSAINVASQPVLIDDEPGTETEFTSNEDETPNSDGQGWVHLDQVKYSSRGPRPTHIRFPDRTEMSVRTWNRVWISIAEWMVGREPSMTAGRFGNSKPTVIKTSDEGFWGKGGFQLKNGLWIEPGVTGNTLLRTARSFLAHFNVDPSSVWIKFDDSP